MSSPLSLRDFLVGQMKGLLGVDGQSGQGKPLQRRAVPRERLEAWADELFCELVREPFSRNGFLAALDKILVTFYHSFSTELSAWSEVIIALATGILHHRSQFSDAHTILSTLTYATTLVYDIRMNEGRKREYILNDDRVVRRRITNVLLLKFDMDTLAQEFRLALSRLGISTAFIGIFSSPVKRDTQGADRTINAIIGFDGEHDFNLHREEGVDLSFSDYFTISGFDYDRELRCLFMLPLFSMDEEVGMMLLPYEPRLPTDVYETLRINISTTLKGAQLFSTVHTLSVTDELTGLYNRRGFFQFAFSRLHHLRRNDESISLVMFMDMDGLKQINDEYGHGEGDNAIRVFSETLKHSMREEDIIGRIGGDEFAVLSSVRSSGNARQLEGRIRQALENYNAQGLHPYRVEASIGCVELQEATQECLEMAMRSADNVLYEEKKRKRKRDEV